MKKDHDLGPIRLSLQLKTLPAKLQQGKNIKASLNAMGSSPAGQNCNIVKILAGMRHSSDSLSWQNCNMVKILVLLPAAYSSNFASWKK